MTSLFSSICVVFSIRVAPAFMLAGMMPGDATHSRVALPLVETALVWVACFQIRITGFWGNFWFPSQHNGRGYA